MRLRIWISRLKRVWRRRHCPSWYTSLAIMRFACSHWDDELFTSAFHQHSREYVLDLVRRARK